MPQNRETGLADIIAPFAEGAAQYLALPPLLKNRQRAMWGAGLLAWCAYVAIELHSAVGADASDLARFINRLPNAPQEVWLPVAIWGGFAAFGLLWLSVGLRGSRGLPRDLMSALWSLVIAGGCAAALWYGWYLPREWEVLNFLLQGSYWAMIAAELIKFWLAVRPTGSGSAARLVKRQIDRQTITWRTGSRRRQF